MEEKEWKYKRNAWAIMFLGCLALWVGVAHLVIKLWP